MSAGPHHIRTKGAAGTTLGIERTYLSADRTLMSAVRTAFSLIGFAFTVYLIFTKGARAALVPADPVARYFAMSLMSMGVLVLALGLWGRERTGRDLQRQVERLRAAGLDDEAVVHQPRSSFALAVITLVLAIAGLAAMAFRLLD